jgi:hypothetical protein
MSSAKIMLIKLENEGLVPLIPESVKYVFGLVEVYVKQRIRLAP